MSSPSQVGRSISPLEVYSDRAFRALTAVLAWSVVLLVLWVVVRIGQTSWPAIQKYGLGFLARTDWDAGRQNFGIWPQIAGTLYSSTLGLVIGTLFGLAVAIVLSQDFLPPRWEWVLTNVVQLLAAIPSVVYGLWGLFVVVPLLRPPANALHAALGWIPIFGTRLSGPGMLPTAVVLAIMILPTISAVSRDAIAAVPRKMTEAAYGMGATRWETILNVVLPTAAPGIFGAIILGFDRAVGETMAVAMLIGNSEVFNWSLFSPGTTLAALLANHFAEANQVEIGALMYAALVLLAITLLINIAGEFVLNRATAALEGINKWTSPARPSTRSPRTRSRS